MVKNQVQQRNLEKRKRQEEKLQKKEKELKKAARETKNFKSNHKKSSSFLDFFKKEKKRYTIEDTIPYKKMYRNGICYVGEGKYNKVIKYEDINYQLALEEDRDLIFNQFAGFLNSFDSTTELQLSFVNQVGRIKEMENAITIPDKGDDFDEIRKEFREMLKDQLSKGNNGLKKSKYVVISTRAETYDQAKPVLERIEIDVLSNLKSMGVRAETLIGVERLKLLHDMLNPDKMFDYDGQGLEARDTRKLIMPSTFKFISPKYMQMGNYICALSHFQILASELSDRFLSEILSIEDNMYVSFHIHAIDQVDAIKMVKRKNTDLQKMMIEEQKKAVRAGYDMDIIPSDLNVYGNDIKNLLTDLQSRDERMFYVTFTIMNLSKNKEELDNTIAQISSICNRNNCALKRLDHQQEQGFISILPLGVNKIEIKRQLTSSSTAVFMPFTTEELFMSSNTSLYYGLNALSHNLIMADRKKLKNPNGLILGTPGAGKSFAAKREMANAILVTDDDVIITDPEGEYGSLVKEFNGEVIKISAKSKDYLNPLDINMNYGDGDAPLKDKANFIMSMLELVVGGSGLTAAEKSVIDRCLPKIYKDYFDNPIPENMPILSDLYNLLQEQEESVGRKLATEMEIYVTGSLNVFNNRSNVDLNKKLISFDIKELGNQLKKIGMLVIQDQVWNKVSSNRGANRATRYYIDEFHLLLKDQQTAQYSVEIWKRFRKWGGVPTGITQNVKDLLGSAEIENIFDNTDFVLMLNQASGDREILAKKLKISPFQLNYVTNSNAGEGLLFFGNTIVPFADKFPKDTILYKKMTTKPEEVE
ncbi:DUF87 domain-containing protein [Clostridium sporogenes]|uniref:VirB4-like conjugal transfer ATPase, CD1110 family n=1 Tax=Clostridium sporogenes TaxID=1509 RepID=UPI00313C2DDA